MILVVALYLGIGLYMQCAMFTLNPDWTDPETWRHLLLWPGYAWPFLPGPLRHAALPGLPTLPSVHGLYVVLATLFLLPLPVIWLAARRLRAHGRRRTRTARPAAPAAPGTEAVPVPAQAVRMEPRFGT